VQATDGIDEATNAVAARWLDDHLRRVTDAPSGYGDAFADVYDEWYPDRGDTAAAVDFLSALALGVRAGDAGVTTRSPVRVLELGAGTGRLALPLAARLGAGSVVALDASAAMLDRLRAKPGSDGVVTVLGDMGGDLPTGPFGLVVAATNTLFNLARAGAQERCVTEVASRLEPGGRFVVEAFVPDDAATDGDRVSRPARTRTASGGDVLTVSRTHLDEQVVTGAHLEIVDGAVVRARPWNVRWKSPSQLDELCAHVGLAVEERVSDWSRSPFGRESIEHVSVYGHATA
jgi:SAM-dependent methyltransferase